MLQGVRDILDTQIVFELDLVSNAEKADKAIGKFWYKQEDNEKKVLKALKKLPNDCFIVFQFAGDGDNFVQFTKNDGFLILDLPLLKNTALANKKKSVIALLGDRAIRERRVFDSKVRNRNRRYEIRRDNKKGDIINVHFWNNDRLATRIVMDIGKKTYDLESPFVEDYIVGDFK